MHRVARICVPCSSQLTYFGEVGVAVGNLLNSVLRCKRRAAAISRIHSTASLGLPEREDRSDEPREPAE